MGLDKYSAEEIAKMSMIDLASKILTDEKKELNFMELFEKVAEYKQFTEAEKEDLLARFYTDLNVDGRFSTIGSNLWGLKRWYPVDQTSEKALAESRKRDLEDEDLLEDEDEFLEEEDLLDEEEEDIDLFDDFEDLDYADLDTE